MLKKIIVLHIFFIFSFVGANAQNVETIVFEAPSSKYISIPLQSHNGKLRFGTQDEYFVKPDGSYYQSNSEEYPIIDKKMTENLYGKQGFMELLKMRFQDDMYSVMDRKFFTKRTNNMYDKDLKSFTAQQHMLKLANSMLNSQEMRRFLCNEKTEDCDRKYGDDIYYHGGLNNMTSWGGKGASEFQKSRAYTSFVSENFEPLKKWASTLLPENKADGFFVIKTRLEEYDFESQGFWINSNRFAHNNYYLVKFSDFEPSNGQERKLVHPQGIKILLAMSPEKAEVFSEKHKELYLVFDVHIELKGIHNYRHDVLKTNFSLNNSLISIYTDDSLTKKVEEIDINSMTSKNP